MNPSNPAERVRPPESAYLTGIGVGLCLVAFGLHAEWFVQQSANWEPVSAQVTVSETRAIQRSGRSDVHHRFAYRYIVDGKVHDADRYSYRGRRHEGVARYRRGDIITAYVDPSNPTSSVVARDLKWWDRLYAPLGMLLALAAWFKRARDRRRG